MTARAETAGALLYDLALDRAYRDGLRAGFQMGEHGEVSQYEAIRANLDREIAEAAKVAKATGASGQ